jgi:hypothetical protein
MWRPESWAALEALVGQAEETSALDFKREFGSSKETAKDIAAMSVNGGTILYGVDEDPASGVVSELTPVALKGAEERLQQIAASRISPAPAIEVTYIRSPADPEYGIVAVVVPPSAWAPHQLDGRYPVRRGTTTDNLEEAEVERLYRARYEASGGSPQAAFAAFVEPPGLREQGFPHDAGVGVLQLAVVSATGAPHPRSPWLADELPRLVAAASDRTTALLYDGVLPSFFSAGLERFSPRGAEGWGAGEESFGAEVLSRRPRSVAILTYPSSWSFWISLPLSIRDGEENVVYRSAMEWRVASELIAALTLAGEFMSQVPTAGILSVSLDLAGFDDAIPWWLTKGRPDAYPGGGAPVPARYLGATYGAAAELRESPQEVVRALIDPWLASFYQGRDLIDGLLRPPG